MTENTAVETTTEVVPSKFAFLRSKITREGLILGGVIAGIIIAGGYTLLKTQAPLAEIEDLDATDRETLVNLDTLAKSGNL
jgi:hypothetical protein